jgi:peptide deformylase
MNNKILQYPDPFLKTEAIKIYDITEEVMKEIDYMFKIMEKIYTGLGLSSIQVGIKNSIILYRDHGKPKDNIKVLLNAKISAVLDTNLQRSEEGCFSLPEIFIPIRRYKKIEVFGIDLKGNRVFIEADGMLSNVLQHEIDHLNGILMIDKLSRLQKSLFKKKLKGIKK